MDNDTKAYLFIIYILQVIVISLMVRSVMFNELAVQLNPDVFSVYNWSNLPALEYKRIYSEVMPLVPLHECFLLGFLITSIGAGLLYILWRQG